MSADHSQNKSVTTTFHALDPDLTEKRPILVICGCQKYQEFLAAAAIRMRREESWKIITVIGGGDGNPVFDGNQLILPVNDNYESLPTKVHAMFSWIYQKFPNSPGVWKTDDDILYKDMKDLQRAIQKNKDKSYWGLVSQRCPAANVELKRINARFEDKTLRPTHQMATYCFGHGYWISRSAMRHILEAEKDYKQSYLEDVCTGFVLNRKGMKPSIISPIPYKEVSRDQTLLNLSVKE
jgi:hypothetical protein